MSGHKTVSGLRCSKLISLGFVGVFLGVVLNLAGRARVAHLNVEQSWPLARHSGRTNGASPKSRKRDARATSRSTCTMIYHVTMRLRAAAADRSTFSH